MTENLYHQRVLIEEGDRNKVITPNTLGITAGDAFFVSIASVDEDGHESLFAFPEVRCDSSGCAIPAYAQSAAAPVPAAERPAFKDIDKD